MKAILSISDGFLKCLYRNGNKLMIPLGLLLGKGSEQEASGMTRTTNIRGAMNTGQDMTVIVGQSQGNMTILLVDNSGEMDQNWIEVARDLLLVPPPSQPLLHNTILLQTIKYAENH
uniref:Uncharacterized protein n=1 Tax=Nelumbo nucifera TaxID=4432 RepID=A0A822ZA09_NELNU|nr:TPA_asm: hypothetical protein HUJ06_014562 [Nelumbo nucifera]